MLWFLGFLSLYLSSQQLFTVPAGAIIACLLQENV